MGVALTSQGPTLLALGTHQTSLVEAQRPPEAPLRQGGQADSNLESHVLPWPLPSAQGAMPLARTAGPPPEVRPAASLFVLLSSLVIKLLPGYGVEEGQGLRTRGGNPFSTLVKSSSLPGALLIKKWDQSHH